MQIKKKKTLFSKFFVRKIVNIENFNNTYIFSVIDVKIKSIC
jgi:hypothetical protein